MDSTTTDTNKDVQPRCQSHRLQDALAICVSSDEDNSVVSLTQTTSSDIITHAVKLQARGNEVRKATARLIEFSQKVLMRASELRLAEQGDGTTNLSATRIRNVGTPFSHGSGKCNLQHFASSTK
jgi:hypothetical protein